jgi:hypothetical protein
VRFRGDPRYQLSLLTLFPDGGERCKLDSPVDIYCANATMPNEAKKAVVVLATSKPGETDGV